jgi:hypothetical protein
MEMTMSNELGVIPSMDFGIMPAVEIPLDSSNVAACSAMDDAGCVPADDASNPIDFAKPSAICERHEFPTQTNRSFMD